MGKGVTMNHIEKMMKTAGVTLIENKCQDCPYNMEECRAYYCPDFKYPDFTAEKQLEIIRLIGLERGFKIIPNEGYDYILSEDTYAKYELNKQGYSMTDFPQALAQLTTELMKADKLDKEDINRILEK